MCNKGIGGRRVVVLELCCRKRLKSSICRTHVPVSSPPRAQSSQAHDSCKRCCCPTKVIAEIKASKSQAGTDCKHAARPFLYSAVSHLSSLNGMLRRNGSDDSLILGGNASAMVVRSMLKISICNLHFILSIYMLNKCGQLSQK